VELSLHGPGAERPRQLNVTTADEDRIAARRAEAIRLRVRERKTFKLIAEELGISVGQAHADVRTAMTEIAKEAEENVRAERGSELYRLDQAFDVVDEVIRGAIENADPERPDASLELKLKALDRLVKIQDQRAKLLGLYAPERKEVDARVASVGLEDLDTLRKTIATNEDDTGSTGGDGGSPA
jgi:hypothetical protein